MIEAASRTRRRFRHPRSRQRLRHRPGRRAAVARPRPQRSAPRRARCRPRTSRRASPNWCSRSVRAPAAASRPRRSASTEDSRRRPGARLPRRSDRRTARPRVEPVDEEAKRTRTPTWSPRTRTPRSPTTTADDEATERAKPRARTARRVVAVAAAVVAAVVVAPVKPAAEGEEDAEGVEEDGEAVVPVEPEAESEVARSRPVTVRPVVAVAVAVAVRTPARQRTTRSTSSSASASRAAVAASRQRRGHRHRGLHPHGGQEAAPSRGPDRRSPAHADPERVGVPGPPRGRGPAHADPPDRRLLPDRRARGRDPRRALRRPGFGHVDDRQHLPRPDPERAAVDGGSLRRHRPRSQRRAVRRRGRLGVLRRHQRRTARSSGSSSPASRCWCR